MAFTFFTPLMGFAMRPNDTKRPARYHRGSMDLDWQKELALYFQMPADYEQKVETGDPIRFQVKSTANTSHTLQIINCRGQIITALATTTNPVSYPGDVAASGEQYITYHYAYADWKNLNGLGDIFKGTYYFLYTVQYDAVIKEVYVSEPINIKAYQPNTVLMEYTNPSYYQGSPFDAIPAIFRFRFEGYYEDFQPRSAATVFNDQRQDVKVLDYNPYRVQTLFVGEPDGMADWVFDKLNRIMGCKAISIDGKRYTVSSGNPSWNKDSQVTSPQKTGSLEIQDAFDGEGFTFPVRKLKLWTTPLVYPYMLGGVGVSIFTLSGPIRMANSAADTSIVTTLNGLIQGTELLGTITKEGNDFYYNNAPGETYGTTFAPVYTRRLVWNIVDPGPAIVSSMEVADYEGVVAWGDGTLNRYVVGSIPVVLSHTYGSVGLFSMEFWHLSLGRFSLTATNAEQIGGNSPTNCREFIVNNHDFTSNVFFWGMLQDSRDSLQLIDLRSNNLTGANNFRNWVWKKLKTMLLSENKFPSATMNQGIVDCDANSAQANPPIKGGTYDIRNQVPPAVIATNGLLAESNLNGRQWIVRY